MRLLLLGATGRTGAELIERGLERGHNVTALVRSPHKIVRCDPRLRVVRGDPRSLYQMTNVVQGHDAVVSSLGPAVGEAMRPSTLLAECAAAALAAMNAARVRRFLVVSSALLFPGGGPRAGAFRWLIRPHLRDCAAMETAVAASATDWTIVRPPRLVLEGDDAYRVRKDALPNGADLSHARASWRAVATFLLDAVQNGAHVRETVGMCR